MWKQALVLLVWFCALTGCASPVNSPATAPRVVIVAVGDVDASLVKHAREWSEENLALKVDIAPAIKTNGVSLDEAAARASAALDAMHPYVVALAMMPANITSHGMRTASGKVSVVNVGAMQADKPAKLVLEKRIERQTIRAISRMLDQPTCPNPQCVLTSYSSLGELDRSGRNLCPPCLGHLQKAAEAQHLEIDTNSAFYLGR